MQIGIVGKTNTGKSTFFSAATLVDAEIGNRPFVTIKPNQGTGYVSTKCIHPEKGTQCQPVNSRCIDGTRLIPLTLLDVAGLIEGAWQGKGLGNQFMNDLMQASALIHVLDASGRTDAAGNPCREHDPGEDVRFLEKEVAQWIKGILTKNWAKISKSASATKKVAESLGSNLTGLGIGEADVRDVLERKGFSDNPTAWGSEEILRFSSEIMHRSKPMLIAANKMDVEGAKDNYERLVREFPERIFVPCCAEAELALRKAERAGIIKYAPGNSGFEVLKQELPEAQKKALEFIRANVLERLGSTGVQQALNKTAFELLGMIVAYPVQDQNKWISGKGHLLPDAYLVRKGTTPRQLAGKIHSEFLNRYIGAVNCRTGQKVSEDYELQSNDVIKIQLSR